MDLARLQKLHSLKENQINLELLEVTNYMLYVENLGLPQVVNKLKLSCHACYQFPFHLSNEQSTELLEFTLQKKC